MRKLFYLFIFLFLFISTPAMAWMSPVIAGGGVPAAGGPSYIAGPFDFEETGTPAGWTEPGTGIDYDNTSSPLVGSQDLLITTTNDTSRTATVGYSISGTIYVKLMYKTGNSNTDDEDIFRFLDSGSVVLAKVMHRYNHHFYVIATGGDSDQDVATFPTDTLYVWIIFTPGTGSNASIALYYNTTDSMPETPVIQSTNGTTTNSSAEMICEARYSDIVHIDEVIIDDSPID